ncbi:MAG: hypothetical protein V7720_11375 [Halioglobus sp.]
MAAIAFDTLRFARRLIEAGVPDRQAEVQAELMAEAFLLNMDSVVTKDYLDARLGEQEARIEAKFNVRIASVENKLNLHSWMLAIIAASTVIPAITRLLGY